MNDGGHGFERSCFVYRWQWLLGSNGRRTEFSAKLSPIHGTDPGRMRLTCEYSITRHHLSTLTRSLW